MVSVRLSHLAIPIVTAVLLVILVQAWAPTAVAAADGGPVTLFWAPDSAFGDADAVETAIESGTAEDADKEVVGGTLIVVINSGRLADSMAAGDGSPTDRFFDALDGEAAFRIAQTNPTPQRSRKVAQLGPENVSVHRADTITYVLVDTGALSFYYHGSDGVDRAALWDGERFAVTFGYDLPEHDTSGPEFELYHAKAEFVSLYRYAPLAPEVVRRPVKVNIEPDEAVVARITLPDDQTITAPVEPVAWSGFPGVALNLSGVDPGAAYALELVHDGTVVDRYNGTVLRSEVRVTDATLTEVETEHLVTKSGQRVVEVIDDHTAVNVTMTISHGGRVEVLDASCEEVGHERVEPGRETQVTIELWEGGKPMRGKNESDYGVLVRILRVDGAGETLYPGQDAELALNLDGDGCQPSSASPSVTHQAPEASQPPPTSDAIPSNSVPESAQRGGGREAPTTGSQSANEEITTPGQPGFTVGAALVGFIVVGLVRSRRG